MTPHVVVVGLGPAGPELAPAAVLDVVAAHPPEARWARTDRHPAASVLGEHRSFDHVYDDARQLTDVYRAIVEALVAEAGVHGSVCYAVPGSPLVAEATADQLRAAAARGEVALEVVPALSFLDLAWSRLGVDPLAAGVRLVDGHRFAVDSAGERGPLLVAQCDSLDVLTTVKLAVDEGPEGERAVTVLQRLGLATETVCEIAWDDLDRAVRPDHLTTLWIPQLSAPVATELVRFDELVHTLRRQCPWDRVQTHASLEPYLVEEAYEVVDAIRQVAAAGDEPSGDAVDALEEELGDLLFQVVFHATIAEQGGHFTLADVARTIHDKLWRRHPHVFADAPSDPASLVGTWDRIKAAEKGRTSTFDGIPEAFPARLYAEKVLRRAAQVGVELDVDLSSRLATLEEAERSLRAAADAAMFEGRARERPAAGGAN